MDCGYATFRRRFTQLAGIGPAQYRLQSQVNLASSIIMDQPHIGNKSLADRCGFSDEYHFSKQFKRIAGMSPRDYRIRAVDPFGNVADSATVQVTVAGSGSLSEYARTVISGNPTWYYRLGESSGNAINVARATIAGLQSLQRPDEVAARRGLPADSFVPKRLLKAYTERQREGAPSHG